MPTISYVIPAFQESPYLEACLESLRNQTVESEIIITTSTPNILITKAADKFKVPVLINMNGGSIAKDWNFAIKQGSGNLIVLAHQDDFYSSAFSSEFIQFHKKNPRAGIIFSQINELINNEVFSSGKREFVKNILRALAFKKNSVISSHGRYRQLLGFGCAIPCPAVAFSKNVAQNLIFSNEYSLNLDWDTWSTLAEKEIPFGYIPKPLMTHRIHPGAETQAGIKDKRRAKEDYQLFLRYWPSPIAKLLLAFYQMGY